MNQFKNNTYNEIELLNQFKNNSNNESKFLKQLIKNNFNTSNLNIENINEYVEIIKQIKKSVSNTTIKLNDLKYNIKTNTQDFNKFIGLYKIKIENITQ